MKDFYRIKRATLVGIADAIRSQSGKNDDMTPEEMRVDILNLFRYAKLTPAIFINGTTDVTANTRVVSTLTIEYTTILEDA